jgi:hypothetical protein
MLANFVRLLAVWLATLLVFTTPSLAEDISISGLVHTNRQKPIHMIKVTVYRGDRELRHVFTGADGRYTVSVPKGAPVALRFDTHWSLNNSEDWHPSVVANLDTAKDLGIDRTLLRAGEGDDINAYTTFIDALSGYQFGAFWEETGNPKLYAQSAVARLGKLKLPLPVLDEVQRKLQEHFRERARGP